MDSTCARPVACVAEIRDGPALEARVKQLLEYLTEYLKEDFHFGYYLTIAVFLVVTFTLNFSLDFKREILNPTLASPLGILYFAAFYAFAYYFAVFAGAFFGRDARLLRSPAFWGVTAFAILAMALDNYSTNLPRLVVAALDLPDPVLYWVGKCVWNLDRMVALMLPILAYRHFIDDRPGGFYGLTLRGFDARPYVFMLMVMAPLVLWASFRPAFLDTYPDYRAGRAEAFLGVSQVATYGAYEVSYGLRYVAIELFFRGFLLLGLERFLGRAVLMPMVTLYAFWHFGKPVPEAIGSIFAGYILGVIALRTRSIVGGILVHVGVALGMDGAAHLHGAAPR
jgi:hypothetical protein